MTTTDKTDAGRANTAQSEECCYRLRATKAVLADRERELLDLKGPCNRGCRLHYAHSGPCDITEEATSA